MIGGRDVIPGKRKKQCRRGNQLARERDPDPIHLRELQVEPLQNEPRISPHTQFWLTFWNKQPLLFVMSRSYTLF